MIQAFQTPNIPELLDAVPALGIESLQKMGTKFLLCGNALGAWCLELQARGKGKADAIQKELTEYAARRHLGTRNGHRNRERRRPPESVTTGNKRGTGHFF